MNVVIVLDWTPRSIGRPSMSRQAERRTGVGGGPNGQYPV